MGENLMVLVGLGVMAGLLVLFALVVRSLAINYASDMRSNANEWHAFASVASEKALGFSDEQREVMRIQRESPAQRVDTPGPSAPVVPPVMLAPPNFQEGAEFRVGG